MAIRCGVIYGRGLWIAIVMISLVVINNGTVIIVVVVVVVITINMVC